MASDLFDPNEFASFKRGPAPAVVTPPSGGGFDPAAFDAFKNGAPAAAPAKREVPELKDAPGWDFNTQFSPGTDIGNRLADVAATTAHGAIRNAPGSAVEFAKNVVQPIIHPIDTATALKNLGMGVLEKTGILSGQDHEKYADAVGQFLADRYGGIENVRKTLETDPVGLAGDLSMILTGGGSAAARLPGLAGRTGDVVAAAGRAIDPITAAAPAVLAAGRGAGHLASDTIGLMTGHGGEPLRVAANAGLEGGPAARAFRENISGAAPMEDAVADARRAVAQMRQERGQAYRTGMAGVGQDPTILNFNQIDQAVANAQGVKTYRGRSGTAQEQSLSPRTEAIRTEMENAIEHWRGLDPAEFHSAEGIDALKQQLGDIRDATQPHTPERVAADNIYRAVRQTIIDQVPEYARVMQGYERASTLLKEIETTLSLKPGANIDTALRKLQSTLRDNVNTSFGRRAELANYLVNAGAPHLMERLAGQALQSWMPRGLARLALTQAAPATAGLLGAGAAGAGAAAAATLPMMSPRLMGEAAYLGGIGARTARRLSPALRPARAIGEAVVDPFSDAGYNPYGPQ